MCGEKKKKIITKLKTKKSQQCFNNKKMKCKANGRRRVETKKEEMTAEADKIFRREREVM